MDCMRDRKPQSAQMAYFCAAPARSDAVEYIEIFLNDVGHRVIEVRTQAWFDNRSWLGTAARAGYWLMEVRGAKDT